MRAQTLRLSTALLPLLRPHARVVNVASMAGMSALAGLDEEKLERVRSPSLTVEGLSDLMQEFVDAAAAGDVREQGWPMNSCESPAAGPGRMRRWARSSQAPSDPGAA